MNRLLKISILIFFMSMSSACDCQNTTKCEWEIALDNENADMASDGYVTVCIRNFNINRQKCFIEIERNLFESTQNKKFIYREIEIDPAKMPRRIKSLSACKP